MSDDSPIPELPRLGYRLLEPLPLWPLSLLLGAMVRELAARHPSMFTRLGEHAGKRFLIDPTDLPMAFLLCPRMADPRIAALRRPAAAKWDCRIAGPLAALLGMTHGAYDGDALFFSRDIVMEGDTAAVLALRNALDDAELDLFSEAAGSFGSLGAAAGHGLRPLVATLGRLTRLPLTRSEFIE